MPRDLTTELDDRDDGLLDVLESAARLQELVPDTVLVGRSAAALHNGHRASYDHDHVLADLRDRFELVLDALEREGDWVTNRATPGKLVLGSLGGIESGVRQLIRTRPLETTSVTLPSGRELTVPTAEETLRVKAFLIVKRNQVRDYLDVAALGARYGFGSSARVLSGIDEYYADTDRAGEPVATQVARQLADPAPRDTSTLGRLGEYKALTQHWRSWDNVTAACGEIARRMADEDWG
ncbi:hypothetical protein CLV30_101414 [Haloactinopolyspora alba]|uniref:Nucleotidyltransferase AbiEii toxin of type IV toxin-antitoxin system n=1 Tax=Haloactinopolyspora alba TaxID=648780 RepID=A0A2P8EG56_9ACTN|nr:hypothetical protein CLV30_101414 [Haloactinopolyspora alba]